MPSRSRIRRLRRRDTSGDELGRAWLNSPGARTFIFQDQHLKCEEELRREPTGEEQQREHVCTERFESGGAGGGLRQHQRKDDIETTTAHTSNMIFARGGAGANISPRTTWRPRPRHVIHDPRNFDLFVFFLDLH